MKGNSVRIGFGGVLAITGFNILCVCIKDILPIEIRAVLLMVMPFLRFGLFVCLYWLLLFNLIRKVESVSYSKTFKYFICIAFALCTFFFIFVFCKAYAFWNFRQNFEKIVLIAAIPFFLIWSAICVKTWLTIIKRKDRKNSSDCIEDEPAKSRNKAKKYHLGLEYG